MAAGRAVPGWYGEGDRIVEICSGCALWRHAGMPVVPIRWVLLRDPHRRFDPQALLCTDTAQDPVQVVRWFVQRWQLEVTCIRPASPRRPVPRQRFCSLNRRRRFSDLPATMNAPSPR